MSKRRATDPQVPGGRYLCGYWQETYTVLAMWSDMGRTTWYRVLWADGRTTVHCTAWSPRTGDQVIAA
jgi:hypothetical protein